MRSFRAVSCSRAVISRSSSGLRHTHMRRDRPSMAPLLSWLSQAVLSVSGVRTASQWAVRRTPSDQAVLYSGGGKIRVPRLLKRAYAADAAGADLRNLPRDR